MTKLNKTLFSRTMGFVVFALFLSAANSASAQDIRSMGEELLHVETVAEFKKTVVRVADENRRARACEFQRRSGLPPTFCYGNGVGENAPNEAELDLECVKLSRSATTIPKSDVFTSSVCREALEKRRRDLEYAAL